MHFQNISTLFELHISKALGNLLIHPGYINIVYFANKVQGMLRKGYCD